MSSITVNAYAKINIYLDVTGKRQDGYHLLETIMHTVSLCDIVTISENSGNNIRVLCSDADIPCDERNIAYKCADAFFRSTGTEGRGVDIHIEKHIPSQAGMGGGSADGAAVLKGMNELFSTGLSTEQLCDIGVKLGADIPFCIVGGCGYCTGIGEIIESLPVLSGTVLIGKGTHGISTGEAFSKIDSLANGIGLEGVRSAFLSMTDISGAAPYCRNLFDEVTNLGEVERIKNIMTENGAVSSCMTGSGSAVFGLYKSDSEAEYAAELLKKKGYFSAVCSFI